MKMNIGFTSGISSKFTSIKVSCNVTVARLPPCPAISSRMRMNFVILFSYKKGIQMRCPNGNIDIPVYRVWNVS